MQKLLLTHILQHSLIILLRRDSLILRRTTNIGRQISVAKADEHLSYRINC